MVALDDFETQGNSTTKIGFTKIPPENIQIDVSDTDEEDDESNSILAEDLIYTKKNRNKKKRELDGKLLRSRGQRVAQWGLISFTKYRTSKG